MAFPLTRQGFVVKPLDGSQTLRPGKPGNVLPFLVTLQNLDRDCAGKLPIDATVLFDLPHTTLCIYHKWYGKYGNGIRDLTRGAAALAGALGVAGQVKKSMLTPLMRAFNAVLLVR